MAAAGGIARPSAMLMLLSCISSAIAARSAACRDFLDKNEGTAGIHTRPSGLQYKVVRAGSGTAHPVISTPVECHYTGQTLAKYPNGPPFDTSRSGPPVTFAPKEVIQGWTEALQLMVEGDIWTLFVPSELGYGDGGMPQAGIQGGDCLIFTLEVLKIKGATVPAASPPPPPAPVAAALPLPRCTDPPSPTLPPAIDCASLEHADEVRAVLCPRIAAVQMAPCAQLGSLDALSRLLGADEANMTVLVATANVTRSVDFRSY